MHFVLKRFFKNEQKTLGTLYMYSAEESGAELICMFKTLELPWKNNERRVSCIPIGTYEIKEHTSPKFGWSLWLQDVPNRTAILIHRGNYTRDILGCILPGLYHTDIDNDGIKDVVHSTITVETLKHYIKMLKPNKITITITE